MSTVHVAQWHNACMHLGNGLTYTSIMIKIIVQLCMLFNELAFLFFKSWACIFQELDHVFSAGVVVFISGAGVVFFQVHAYFRSWTMLVQELAFFVFFQELGSFFEVNVHAYFRSWTMFGEN